MSTYIAWHVARCTLTKHKGGGLYGRWQNNRSLQMTLSNNFFVIYSQGSNQQCEGIDSENAWDQRAMSHYLNQWWAICWRMYASHGLDGLMYKTVLFISWRRDGWRIYASLGSVITDSGNGLSPIRYLANADLLSIWPLEKILQK